MNIGLNSLHTDIYGEEHFSMTFEVNGLNALKAVHKDFIEKEIKVGGIENRGHTGRNFVFYDLDGNKFDIELASDWYVGKWGAELSYKDEDKAILKAPIFKDRDHKY